MRLIVSGARQWRCAKVVGIDERTLQRWRANELGEDGRRGPLTEPANKLSAPPVSGKMPPELSVPIRRIARGHNGAEGIRRG